MNTSTHLATTVRLSRSRANGIGVVLAAVLASATAATVTGQRGAGASPSTSGAWVTAWATSQQALGEAAISNATVRMIARVTIPGDAVRVRLDNGYSTEPIRIGRASIGYRVQGAAVAAGSNRAVTFDTRPDVTVPPGGTVWSDPVVLPVQAQQDLAISLFVPGASIRPSQHTGAVVTSYRSADGSGDATAVEGREPFTGTLTSTWWVKAINVHAVGAARTIVAFGDSITDGTCSTLDAHDRWVDVLAVRLALQSGRTGGGGSRSGPLLAVVNEGIGGNTVTREGLQPPPDSLPGVERLDRDVLSHHGVTDVIVFMGTNDLRRDASVEQIETGLSSILRRIRATQKGIRVIGVTIIPRHNVAASGTNTGWNDEKTRRRNEINRWIRAAAGFDAVLDFDKIVAQAAQPDLLQPGFNCGDGIHPSPAGYFAIGRAIDLTIFDKPLRSTSRTTPDGSTAGSSGSTAIGRPPVR